MKKKSIFGCLAIICLLLVLIPPVLTRAEKHSLIMGKEEQKCSKYVSGASGKGSVRGN